MLYLTNIRLFIGAILLSTATDFVQGKRVYRPDVQLNIILHKEVATWQEAKENCESQGQLLASPVDESLFKYMKSFIDRNNRPTEYYIGTKVTYNSEPQFVSLEGVLLDDMPDAVINIIEQLDPLEGDCLAMSRNSVRAVPCVERLPYLCYKNETTAALKKCVEHDYEYSEKTGSCYKIYRCHDSWSVANNTCTSDGAYLVILNDEEEAKTVVQMFSKESRLPASWVGVRDDTGRGHWRSVHGDSMDKIYNVWHKYATHLYVTDACALLNGDGQLFDYFCNYRYYSICEKNLQKQ